MKKIIIQVVLLVVIVFLGYFVYQSIMEPVHFDQEKRAREKVVIQKLKDIRTSQLVYKRVNGSYSDNFDSLVAFLTDAEIPIVKMVADPNDTTFTKTINDTVGYIKIADSLFSRKSYKLKDFLGWATSFWCSSEIVARCRCTKRTLPTRQKIHSRSLRG